VPASRAVVIGGGVAGLLAARVLRDRFERVTLLERDQVSEQDATRRGVPQSYHPHVLLARGQQILATLFPGLPATLAQHGARWVNWTADVRWWLSGRWAPQCPSELGSYTCSRGLLEATLRQALMARNGIECRDGCQVTELVANDRGNAVQGVRFCQDGGKTEGLAAQLVVDASGRNSAAPRWLQQLGHPAPREMRVQPSLGYTTRWCRLPAPARPDCKVLYAMPQAPNRPRGGIIYPVEGNCWAITLLGASGDPPPSDEAGFAAFARSTGHPELAAAVQAAQPLSPLYPYRGIENRWRHYEALPAQPANFLVMGDASCHFNPVYGQGMTVAALEALALQQALQARCKRGWTRRVQRQLARLKTVPWLMATGEDWRWPSTSGTPPAASVRLGQRYLDHVAALASRDPAAYVTLARVLHLMQPPAALLRPALLAQSWRESP